ncbi:MAG: glycosyltransferase [Candidatus Omnitrophica bacterium]|nr:glycosyltransferase [Candidatus Omnitrophota bacterium]
MKNKKIAVIIPTYNEKDNIIPLAEKILRLPLDISVIIVDDNSPDGTGDIAKWHFQNEPRVEVIIRKEKKGRGYAGRSGYKAALDRKFDIIGEMDGDFSHSPEFIPSLVSFLERADVVSGSRFISGGKSLRHDKTRELVTFLARAYLRLILGIKLTDPTSGFRFFRASLLSVIYPELKSGDAFIVAEVFYYVFKKKFTIMELPIVFYKRKYGNSKLKFWTLMAYLYRVILLRTGFFYG